MTRQLALVLAVFYLATLGVCVATYRLHNRYKDRRQQLEPAGPQATETVTVRHGWESLVVRYNLLTRDPQTRKILPPKIDVRWSTTHGVRCTVGGYYDQVDLMRYITYDSNGVVVQQSNGWTTGWDRPPWPYQPTVTPSEVRDYIQRAKHCAEASAARGAIRLPDWWGRE